MARIRRILNPAQEGKNITLSEARSVFRELRQHEKGEQIERIFRPRRFTKKSEAPLGKATRQMRKVGTNTSKPRSKVR